MGDMLAKDMKWPHCKESVVPENTWNTGLDKFIEVLNGGAGEAWWCCDTDLKYLNLRVDTRDNAFLLTVDGCKDGDPKRRIDPQRVVDAIAKWRNEYGPRPSTVITSKESSDG